MTRGPLVVVGDALLDVDVIGAVHRICPDAPVPVLDVSDERPRPGGAALAALLAARDGTDVVLVTAIGSDAGGDHLRELLDGMVELCAGPLSGATPVKSRVRAGGQSIVRLDRGDGRPAGSTGAMRRALERAGGILVSDYGRGVAADPALREVLAELASRVPLVWDPHPRGPAPVPGARLATPSLAEAIAAAGPTATNGATATRGAAGTGAATTGASTAGNGDRPAAAGAFWAAQGAAGAFWAAQGAAGAFWAAQGAAERLRESWRAGSVVVTLGDAGALLCNGSGDAFSVPAPPVVVADPCGAGDRFAATAAATLLAGALPSEAVTDAVAAASAFVAAGGASSISASATSALRVPAARAGLTAARAGRTAARAGLTAARSGMDAWTLAAATRAAGGTVVATGGCFDLLHIGHVRTLRAARELGDCLIVLLNADESVHRQKGPGRPVVGQAARAEILAALDCVDGVLVFEEDTPENVLAALRPDIWVKGGDYTVDALPETPLVRSWQGQVVTVPYLDGHSTSGLVASTTGPSASTSDRDAMRSDGKRPQVPSEHGQRR